MEYSSEIYFGDGLRQEYFYLLNTELWKGEDHLVLFLSFLSLSFLFQELGTNAVPELPVEQMVEFSITLTDQEYTAELGDPNSPEYQQLAAKFQLQVGMLSEC